MFLDIYFVYLLSGLILLPCILISAFASARVHSVFAKYDGMPTSSDWTGGDTARMLLEKNNVFGVQVTHGKGRLTDNFNPKTMTVTLSDSTYTSNSVAAVAVSAHEIGHVVQREEGYLFYRLRGALVPVTNFGTMLALPLVIVGVLLITCGVAYILGGRVEKRRQDALERRSETIEEQKRARREKRN